MPRFDPTGLVKGWAVDLAAAQLRGLPGVSWCINAGGDVLAGRHHHVPPVGEAAAPWRIAARTPAPYFISPWVRVGPSSTARTRLPRICSAPSTVRGDAASTTTAFTRLLRTLARDPDFGSRVVPIIPDEARTFGMDSLFREFGIYAAHGQKYEPVDHDLLLSYQESTSGQLLEEGITEAGATASWIAAATSYATRGVPMVPFFTFYSMFGFQRVGDLIWSAADARARGFLLGATAGRTTLAGEGLQHQDGHSLLLSSAVPNCLSSPALAISKRWAFAPRGLS